MRLTRTILSAVMCLGLAGKATAQDAPKGITLKLIEKGFDHPLYFVHDPAGRNFVVDQPGRVWMLVDGKKSAKPYLDVVKEVHMDGECGFLSIAFHPKFEENGRLFVNYTRKEGDRLKREGQIWTVVSEFKVDPKADHVDPSTEKLVMTFKQPQSNHNGGLLLFGPDGYLYIGTGDGGNGGDYGPGHAKGGNGQSLQTLLAKILRIDVDQQADDKPYGIPKDNPCYGTLKCLPEIYAYGLRNPWRFSFDRKTGTLFCGDVGQGIWEEVDVIVKGGNYGWHVREGLHSFKDEPYVGTLIDPIAEYKHNSGSFKEGGQSITGGYVYRGKKFPELQGLYLYSDFASGRIWAIRYENDKVAWHGELPVTLRDRTGWNQFSPSSFGEDADGELYVTDYGREQLYQLTVTK
ncbi:PQQ-dependent sugar dehydrogenase [soil metagenome]